VNLLHRLLHRVRIIEQNPFDYRDWQTAVLDQVIVELTKPKVVALSIYYRVPAIRDTCYWARLRSPSITSGQPVSLRWLQ
jgi:hypothetical protein